MLNLDECTRIEATLSALYKISEAISYSSELRETLYLIVESAVQLTGADRGCLVLPNVGGKFEIGAAVHFERPEWDESALGPGYRLVQEAMQERRPLVANDWGTNDSSALYLPRSAVCVPFNVAALYLDSREPAAFSQEELPLLKTLAGQAAVAIENSRLREELHRADRAKSELVAYISHKLSTPLTSIRGYAEMLEKGMAGSLTPEQMVFFRSVTRNVERMQELIAKLQDISRIESGQLRINPQPTAFEEALEHVLTAMRPEIEAQGQRLVLELAADLPMVQADPARLEQILSYLLDNASRYTPKGGQITVRAWAQDDYVHCAIADTGIGISPEDQARLFTKFFRAQNPAVREKFGAGLGLCIARHLAELQGGAMWVNSRLGEGTTVTFTLPVTRSGSA